ncbi:MAG: AarF/UbiB family protein, partial [Patescibacteria group bacterium]
MNSFFKTLKFFKRLFNIAKITLVVSLKRGLTGPQRLRTFFERAGGGFIKFGQILALRQDFIPPSYANELLKLLSAAPEIPFIEMHKVFIKEMGEPVGKFFAEFDATPVASASMAQVYEAQLPAEAGGSKVAVKIQRPGIKEVFEADFLIISFFAGLIDFFRFFTVITAAEVASDFIGWTRRELDFRHESRNAMAFYEYSRGSDQTIIPIQYPEMTTSKVLVQEFIENGVLVEDIILGKIQKDELLKKNIDLELASRYLIKEGMKQYFVDGFFHADPHPANLMLLPGNKLAFLDFGIVGESKETRLILLKFVYGAAIRDIEYMSRHLMEFGRKVFEGEIEIYLQTDITKHGAVSRVFDKIKDIILEDFKKEVEAIMKPWFEALDNKNSS